MKARRATGAGWGLLIVLSAAAGQIAEFFRPDGKTIETRFSPPAGFIRQPVPAGSFAAYLRSLPLKPAGTDVRLFDGSAKSARDVHAAVIDLPIGNRDLHQCADAVIRLRAEYLLSAGRADEIHFNFTNGFNAAYSRWRRGERIEVRGNAVRWKTTERTGMDDRDFWSYLETVFAYAGTASLAEELAPVPGDDPEIGDVFIRPGHPGHAVIVADKAVDPTNGRKIFLLVQSYMPAQEIHVLTNPNDSTLSPWYAAGFGTILRTPEWTFRSAERKRFRDERR